MLELTYRQYKILSMLIETNDYVTSKVLTDSLSITRRTLINDIKIINSQEKLIDSNNRGYYIHKKNIKKVEDLIMFNQVNENDNDILKTLLTARNKISINDFLNQFFISRSSLQKYLSNINKTLKDFDLKIICENQLIYIQGEEMNKRFLLAKMIHQESEAFFSDIQNFSSYFPGIEVDEVANHVINIVKKNQYCIPKYYEMNFLINILVILSRNPYIKEIAVDHLKKKEEMYPEVKMAHEIIQMMGSKYLIHYINPSQVIQELDMCLFGFVHPIGQEKKSPMVHYLSDGFLTTIRNILKNVFDSYYLFSIDYESFLNVFSIHVSELIKRCTYSQNYIPTNLSVRQTSPYIYEVAVSIASKISEKFKVNIPDAEINLIAIHIGYAIEQAIADSTLAPIIIVSDNYRDLGNNIVDKISRQLAGKVQIMGLYHNLEDIPYRDYQECFIISTLQYAQINSKVCYISPFFNETDFQKVYSGIQEFMRVKSKDEFLKLVDMYISDDCFFVTNKKMDKYEVIQFLVEQAIKNKDVNENYLEQVLEREKYSSTA
ncbi:MAG: BglG family transcription antiterminator, partial [Traorella sp.]